MDWKLFAGTFALVFLAELGDKTQLTALAASSGAKSPWSVFAGASLALVLSTLIAVLVGTGLTKVLPDRYLKLAAGVLFLIFGAVLILRNFKPAPEAEEAKWEIKPGFLASFVMERAREFEEASHTGYAEAAKCAQMPELQALFRSLAEEESAHLKTLDAGGTEAGEFTATETTLVCPANVSYSEEGGDRAAVLSAIAHERMTAEFYGKLGDVVHIHSLKPLFYSLASAEKLHLERLENFAKEKGWTA